ncbi:MAG: hypothetical protein ACFCVG_00040 [Kineosporiaceae bacterium]
MTATRAGRPMEAPRPEWWGWIQLRAAQWAAGHRIAAVRMLRVRAIAGWLAVVVLLVALVVVPNLRAGARVYLWSLLLVVVWFALARTKTLTWGTVAGIFAVSVLWAVAIARISDAVSLWAGLPSSSDGSTVAVAASVEESLKLAPLFVLTVVAAGRVRRSRPCSGSTRACRTASTRSAALASSPSTGWPWQPGTRCGRR